MNRLGLGNMVMTYGAEKTGCITMSLINSSVLVPPSSPD